MLKSINQPWAISEKIANRYGETWTNLDFVFEDKISEENFKTDPMNMTLGTLHIAGNHLPMRYKDLLSYSKSLDIFTNNMYAERVGKTEQMAISIKGIDLLLCRHEVAKLYSTVTEAAESAMRAYELGLYL